MCAYYIKQDTMLMSFGCDCMLVQGRVISCVCVSFESQRGKLREKRLQAWEGFCQRHTTYRPPGIKMCLPQHHGPPQPHKPCQHAYRDTAHNVMWHTFTHKSRTEDVPALRTSDVGLRSCMASQLSPHIQCHKLYMQRSTICMYMQLI